MLPATHNKSGRTEGINFSSLNLVISIEGNSLICIRSSEINLHFCFSERCMLCGTLSFLGRARGKDLGNMFIKYL